MTKNSSFTLIELLIVIGILVVLVVTILITLNPAEAQKKTRDVKRMKDLATLESIILQYINDGNPPFCTNDCTSGSQVQPCNNSWIRYGDGSAVDLCNYTKTIPTDPRAGMQTVVVVGETVSAPVTDLRTAYYWITMNGNDYKIVVRQESKSNANNTLNDGGIWAEWVEIGSDLTLQ